MMQAVQTQKNFPKKTHKKLSSTNPNPTFIPSRLSHKLSNHNAITTASIVHHHNHPALPQASTLTVEGLSSLDLGREIESIRQVLHTQNCKSMLALDRWREQFYGNLQKKKKSTVHYYYNNNNINKKNNSHKNMTLKNIVSCNRNLIQHCDKNQDSIKDNEKTTKQISNKNKKQNKNNEGIKPQEQNKNMRNSEYSVGERVSLKIFEDTWDTVNQFGRKTEKQWRKKNKSLQKLVQQQKSMLGKLGRRAN